MVFIESICLDQTIIDHNIRNTISSPECVAAIVLQLLFPVSIVALNCTAGADRKQLPEHIYEHEEAGRRARHRAVPRQD